MGHAVSTSPVTSRTDRMRHGKIELDVPATWSDQSSLLFVGPPPASLPTAALISSPV